MRHELLHALQACLNILFIVCFDSKDRHRGMGVHQAEEFLKINSAPPQGPMRVRLPVVVVQMDLHQMASKGCQTIAPS